MQANPTIVHDLTRLFREELFIDVSADTDLIDSELIDSLQLVRRLVPPIPVEQHEPGPAAWPACS